MSTDKPDPFQECALIVQQEGRIQDALAKFFMLLLNYRYGLDIIVAHTSVEAFSVIQRYKESEKIRCTIVIQNRKIQNRSALSALNQDDDFPLILVLPAPQLDEQQDLTQRFNNVFLCSWEMAANRRDPAAQVVVETAFARNKIGELFDGIDHISHQELQARIKHRLSSVKVLPTLPEIALRIMAMINEPDAKVGELEELISNDPAIVHRLLQVVSTPLFAGSGQRAGGWTVQDAILRLGWKKVGVIAQQIKLMNSLVRPQNSIFDLRRFWEHSVGCALIADRLVNENLIALPGPVNFNDYWISALLHDIGKLLLGFFFWGHFEEVLKQMTAERSTFREAEKELGDVGDHEYLAQILLLRSNATKEVVEGVGKHHTTGPTPSSLVCLVHLANNLCVELGLGYLPDEPARYSDAVLKNLSTTPEEVYRLRELLGKPMVLQIKEVVYRCAHA